MFVGYARVSTQDQNPRLQTDALTAAGCERVYTEKASGAQRDRPELRAALDFMREGDTLVVWKLDRLARSLPQLFATVEDLERRNIGLRVLTQPIDTTTAAGRLFFAMVGAFGEFERSLIRERTLAGLAAARARGRKGGRPRSLTKADLAAARALLRDPDITMKDVAARVGCSKATLERYFPGGRRALVDADATERSAA